MPSVILWPPSASYPALGMSTFVSSSRHIPFGKAFVVDSGLSESEDRLGREEGTSGFKP